MAQTYTTNTSVVLTFVFTAVPTSATYRVSGPDGVLQDWSPLDVSGYSSTGAVNVTIPALLNALTLSDATTLTTPTLDTRDGRLVEVACVFAAPAPPAIFSQEYVVVPDNQQLIIMGNSFQSYVDAVGRASGLQVVNWDANTQAQRVPAMVGAYHTLSRMNYEIYYDRDDIYYRNRASWGLPFIGTIGRLYDYTPANFLALEPDFIESLRQAQIVEADYRMQDPDSRDMLREAGVISSKVGEESEMFRGKRALSYGVCRRALKILGPYVNYSTRLIRS